MDPSKELFTGKITTSSGTFGKIREFFRDIKDTVSDKFNQRKAKDEEQEITEKFSKKLDIQNKELDEKAEKSTREYVIDHINRHMNKSFYDERRAEIFFEKVFAL
jgi:maltodextrin utilization protein YvdJ